MSRGDWPTRGAGGAKGEEPHPRFVSLHPRAPVPSYNFTYIGNMALKKEELRLNFEWLGCIWLMGSLMVVIAPWADRVSEAQTPISVDQKPAMQLT